MQYRQTAIRRQLARQACSVISGAEAGRNFPHLASRSARAARAVALLMSWCAILFASPAFAAAEVDAPATSAALVATVAGSTPRVIRTDGLAASDARAQRLADALIQRLELHQHVDVAVVASNKLMVSVEPVANHGGTFAISFERDFLDSLTDTELQAVVAHELGHVWIFTHHPYLQTEELANSIALQVVTREELEEVYKKVWARVGAKGDIAYFPEP